VNACGTEFLRVMARVFVRGTATWERQQALAEKITDEPRLRAALAEHDAGERERAVARALAFAAGEVSPIEQGLLRALDAVHHRGADTATVLELVDTLKPDLDELAAFAVLQGMIRKGWIGLIIPQGEA
jgi:hypothetical protein